MSLEQKIENLSAVIEKLISALESNAVTVKETPAAPLAAPVSVTPTNPAPSVQTAPAAPQAAPAPAPTQMPAPPVFEPVAAPEVAEVMAEQAKKAPFDTAKGLVDYVMAAYREMGPAKGQGIQKVLVLAGYQNINDVKPEHYFEVWTGIEKLRTA
jgi:hypothetical protein